MLQDWLHLTFLHWRYHPPAVQRLLPPELTIDTFDGSAWIGLVPFEIRNLRPPAMPSIPWLSNFAETNVRTYAIGPDGSRGVWFFSLDAARLAAVVGARASYRLPYFWASMQLDHRDGSVAYHSRRRWPRPAAESTKIAIEPGPAFEPDALGELDHFLTARYRLFTLFGRKLACAPIEHERWPLRRAGVRDCQQTLVQAAGLPEPTGDPLAHYSESILVRIGAPRLF